MTLARSRLKARLVLAVYTALFAGVLQSSSMPEPDWLDSVWIGESDGLIKMDADTGNPLVRDTTRPSTTAVAVDERGGIVWAYSQGKLARFDMAGVKLGEASISSLDVTAMLPELKNPGGPWTDRYCPSNPGGAAALPTSPTPVFLWPYPQLAVDAIEGSAWLGLGNRLYRAGVDGTITLVRTLPQVVTGVSIEQRRGKIWVGQCHHLRGYDREGEGYEVADLLGTATSVRAFDFDEADGSIWVLQRAWLRRIKVDPLSVTAAVALSADYEYSSIVANEHGGAWVGSNKGFLSLRRADATQVFSLEPFTGETFGAISDIAANPRDGSVWVGGWRSVARVSTANTILKKVSISALDAGPTSQVLTIAQYADVIAPDLDILAPLPGAFLSTLRPAIEVGFADIGAGAHDATLKFSTAGGLVPAACTFSSASANCQPTADISEGAVTLSAEIADHLGNTAVATSVSFTLDITDPTITVTSPVPDLVTNNPSLTIAGSISEAGTLVIDGANVSLGAGNTFSHPVTLAVGSNILTLQARDLAGNESERTLEITYDNVIPFITISEPAQNFVTNQAALVITGSISKPSMLTINGVAVALDAQNGFVRNVSLVEQGNHFSFVATDAAGNQGIATLDVTLDTGVPETPDISVIDIGQPVNGDITVVGQAGAAESGATVRIHNRRTGQSVSVQANADGSFRVVIQGIVGDELEIVQIDAATNESAQLVRPVIPPDPALVAPALNENEITPMHESVSFLYSGANPVQIGADPAAFDPALIAVVRGQVLNAQREGLPGVRISVKDHPEYGYTVSRADGMFDLAVNGGGGSLFLNYSASGYLPVQRQTQPSWRAYSTLDAVVMTPLDPVVTQVTLGSAAATFASGSTVADADGARQAAVLFPSGTQATMTLADGSTSAPLTSISVRATEYTVGVNGREAMPGPLPSTSGYTYAVELSVDEALEVGAKSVQFNKDVPVYLDNFLAFPVGTEVPSGYYDRDRGLWVPSRDGRIIKVLSEDANGAVISVSTSGQAATAAQLASLGISNEELIAIGVRYQPNATFWRIPVRHFTPWDFNFPFGLDETAKAPPAVNPEAPMHPPTEDSSECDGCIVEPETQSVGEDLSLTGVPYGLHYRSYRAPKAKASAQTTITVNGPTPPPNIREIRVKVEIAGRAFYYRLPATPNYKFTFAWDGLDAYGRELTGTYPAKIEVSYKFQAVYFKSREEWAASFGTIGDGVELGRSGPVPPPPLPIGGGGGGGGGGNVAMSVPPPPPAPRFITLSRNYVVELSGARPTASMLGNWSLSPHHAYDAKAQILYRGDGSRVSVATPSPVIRTIAGGGNSSAFNIPATQSNRIFSTAMAMSPSGELYIITGGTLARIDGQGYLREVKSNLPYDMVDVAVGPDGRVYLASLQRIHRLEANGSLTHIAGNGTNSYSGDGGQAVNAGITYIQQIEVANDGSIYVLDICQSGIGCSPPVIRRIGPDGIIIGAVAINGRRFALAPDGSIYYSHGSGGVSKYTTRSQHVVVLPGGGQTAAEGDGGVVSAAKGALSIGLALMPNGTLIVNDAGHYRVVTTDDVINAITGAGTLTLAQADGGPALELKADQIHPDFTVADDGRIFVFTGTDSARRLAEIRVRVQDYTQGFFQIPSKDGRELYEFSPSGRHLRTKDAFTGALLYQFAYNTAGQLTQIVDVDGDATTIERDAAGDPSAIIGPDGHRTTLTVDGEGNLATVTNPAGNEYEMTYYSGGLLHTFTDPRENTSTYTFNGSGRLVQDQNAAGGGWTLTPTVSGTTAITTLESVGGRISQFAIQHLGTGATKYTRTAPDGTISTRLADVYGTKTDSSADLTKVALRAGKDPRFGLLSPVTTTTITLPSNKQFNRVVSRSLALSDVANPLSLTSWSETTSLNGKPYQQIYAPATRTWTRKSPLLRQTSVVLRPDGRPASSAFANLNSTAYTYNDEGRLDKLTTGTGADERVTDFNYYGEGPFAGMLQSVTDAENRTVAYEYDLAGRVIKQTLPDGRFIGYGYDETGNLESLTPPGRGAHTFGYDGVNLEEEYTPPTASDIGTRATQYAYTLDKDLDLITRPDGQTVDFVYAGPGQKLSSIVIPDGTFGYHYHATKGFLETLSAPGGQNLAFAYDGFLLTSEAWSGTVSGTVGWAYDNDLRVSSQMVNGAAVSFGYDNDGLLTTAGAESIVHFTNNGLIEKTTLGDVTTAHTYNAFGEPATDEAKYGSNTVYAASYPVRDKLGRVKEKTETVLGITSHYLYTYDAAGRLDTVIKNGALLQDFDYDSNGNRIAVNGVIVASYDGQDRLMAYNDATYTYTANGELASKADAGGTTTYGYDVLGNLRTINQSTGPTIEYVIDGLDRRVGKKIDGVLVQGFLYGSQLEPVAELDGAGNVVSRFVYGTTKHVPDYIIKANVTYRVISDDVGSPRIIINVDDGSIAQQMDFDAFGQIVADTNPGFQPFGFAGGLLDLHSKLTRFGARDYDPLTGRWTARDPILFETASTNLYSYVMNDPINFIDRTGQAEEHTKNARPSTQEKHERGQARRQRDKHEGEKGDQRRDPRGKRPQDWKGPWPPPKQKGAVDPMTLTRGAAFVTLMTYSSTLDCTSGDDGCENPIPDPPVACPTHK